MNNIVINLRAVDRKRLNNLQERQIPRWRAMMYGSFILSWHNVFFPTATRKPMIGHVKTEITA